MNDAARAAFRAVLDYETPPGNGAVEDFLELSEARGFSAHPADWVPHFKMPGQHLPLYQPWVDWLSEQELTPFHEGNTLTEENWNRWLPATRVRAFRKLVRSDQHAAFELLKQVGPSRRASTRLALLSQINSQPSFNGTYPKQVPLVKFFLDDRSAEVRAAARKQLDEMHGLETEEAHAAELAKHITVTDSSVAYLHPPEPHTFPFWANWSCTNYDAMAAALGLSPEALADRIEITNPAGSQLLQLATMTASVEVRSILANRLLEHVDPSNISLALFNGLSPALRDRALQAQFKSHYWHSVAEFLGPDRGTLDAAQMREMLSYQAVEESVLRELETGKLPVNTSYDPLRAVAFCINKECAAHVVEKALSLGMSPDNPRLTMLKFNLAL